MRSEHARVAAALPGYEIGDELGRGAWGIVLAAHHRQLGRDVAIKQLPESLAADAAVRDRFESEARLLATLDHPHVVPIHDYLEHDGLCLLVMERLPGGSVRTRLGNDGARIEDVCAVGLATAAALDAAHRRAILHRDIKPDNLLFSAAEVVKVTDFGIAKVIGGTETLATRAGDVLGTPAYMAPEQALGDELTPATDVYATGVMLYELLAGHLPFPDTGTGISVMFRHVYEDATPLASAAPTVPSAVADVVMQALCTDAEERWADAGELSQALRHAALVELGPDWLQRTDIKVLAGVDGAGAAPSPRRRDSTAGHNRARPPRRARPEDRTLPAPRRGAEAALVPVHELAPPRPRGGAVEAAGAIALLVVTVLLAVGGLGSPDRQGGLPPGTVTVAGADPTGNKPIELDLSKEVPVTVAAAAGMVPQEVELQLSVLSARLGAATARTTPGPDGAVTALLDLSGARYVAAGRVTGSLRLYSGTDTEARQDFPAEPSQPSLLTVPGLVCIVLAMFVLAYAGSFLRSLRAGVNRAFGSLGAVLTGAGLGLIAVAICWLLDLREPTVPTLIACVAGGAASGLLAALASLRYARRRRGLGSPEG